MELPSNTILQNGKYKIVKKIGQGGFGIAYRAYHQGLQTEVCIKEFFYSDLCERAKNSTNVTIISTSPDKIQLVDSLQKKFTKEAQRLARFQHPNIVQVMDTFDENNTAYFVMEFLDGGSLEDMIKRDGAMSEQKAKALILPIIDAMDAVHKKDLLHLDIKPANIMLRKNQTTVLIDFGISKYLEIINGNTTTAPIGISKGFAPLEQYGGSISDFSKATDIYSLCATIYNMVTGKTPPEPLQMLTNGFKSPRDIKPKLTADFNAIIVKGLATKAVDRYQSMSQLMKVINPIKPTDTTIISEANKQHKKNNNLKLQKYNNIYSFSSDGLAEVECKGKWGFIDSNGNEVVKCKYEVVSNFSEGMAAVSFDGKWWGYIDKQGNEVIPFMYSIADDFHEGLASVGLGNPFEMKLPKDHEYGYLNKKGELSIKVKGGGEIFSDGLAKIGFIFNCEYIDKTGNIIIPRKYYRSGDFSEGKTYICKKKGIIVKKEKYGFMDKKGNEIISCIYDDALDFSEGFAPVKKDGKYGFINHIGIEVIPFEFDFAKPFSEDLASIEINGKYGFIDKKGINTIPCEYDYVEDFHEGLASVWLNEKCGVINKNGQIVIPFKYNYISKFYGNRAVVEINSYYSIIDNTGKVIFNNILR
jgi:serine/threonine protein kinase